MTRALVIGRRREGRPIAEGVREAERALRSAGWHADGDVVDRKRDLRRRAEAAVRGGCDAIVVVGGDGAVNEVATKLAGTGVLLGIVPAGTGNLLAANLGIPRRADAAVRAIVGGALRRIDVGRLEGAGRRRGFTVACGIGFDADVMDATSRDQKLRWGRLAYLASAVRGAVELRNVPHRLDLDGEVTELEATQVFIANFGRMLPLISPRPPVRPDDGLLDVFVISAAGPLPALLATWVAISGGAAQGDGSRVFRARAHQIRVESEPERRVEIDGSVVGRTPVSTSVLRHGLSVFVPRR